VLLFGGQGLRTVAGVLKFEDFVSFYTLGHLAAAGDARALSNYDLLHQAQAALVPAASDLIYPPVYPPFTAILFTPFSHLPFLPAAAVWVCLTIGIYAAVVRVVWKAVSPTVPDGRLVAAVAIAFPPFWQLVMNGQVTAIVLVAFTLGWLALERGRTVLAGAALGLLAIKPQFGLVLAVVVLWRREWGLLVGAMISALAQLALVAWWLDGAALTDFIRNVPVILARVEILEAKPWASHSLRSLTRLLPGPAGTGAWLVMAVVFIALAVRTWRPDVPLRVRFGLMILVSVLVSPHLIVYDLTVLALPLLFFAGWMEAPGRQAVAIRLGPLMHALVVALAIPAAQLIGLQVSVIVMAALSVVVAQTVAAESNMAAQEVTRSS
jgi:alpha-1,2-mannosyltransferase